MTQLLIDIAALMPSNSPIPGTSLPATGAACVCTPDRDALFADALTVLLGQSGQPLAAEPSEALLASLGGQSLPLEQPIQWLGSNAGKAESESESQTGIKLEHPKQQDTDDLSPFLFQPVTAGETVAPKTPITLDDQEVAMTTVSESELTQTNATLTQAAQPATPDNISLETAQQSIDAPAPESKPVMKTASVVPVANDAVTSESTRADVQSSEANQAIEPEVSSPVITRGSTVIIEDDANVVPLTIDRGEATPKAGQFATDPLPAVQSSSPATSAAKMTAQVGQDLSAQRPSSASETQPEAKAAIESFVQAVTQFDDDGVPLKIHIAPERPVHSGPESGFSGKITAAELSTNSQASVPVSPDSTPGVETAKPVHEVHQVHKARGVQTGQVSAEQTAPPAETAAIKTAETPPSVQPIGEFAAKQARKAEVSNSARINSTVPTAAAVEAPQQEHLPLARKTPAKASDSLDVPVQSSDDVQAQQTRPSTAAVNNHEVRTTHAASSSNHTQAPERTERAEAPPPVRFEIEIPKPLRVPGQIRVHLDPPELGQVRIDLASRGEGIVGSLRFQSEHARHIVEREIGQLQKTLQDAGVRIERLEVVATSPSNARSGMHTDLSNQQSWSQNTTSQNGYNNGARSHAGMATRNSTPNETAQMTASGRHGTDPTMHAGMINLVA